MASIWRINPQTYYAKPSIRLELYGCPTGEPLPLRRDEDLEGFPLGMETWDIMDGQIAAYQSHSESAPWFARRNFYDTLPNELPFYRHYADTYFWQVSEISCVMPILI